MALRGASAPRMKLPCFLLSKSHGRQSADHRWWCKNMLLGSVKGEREKKEAERCASASPGLSSARVHAGTQAAVGHTPAQAAQSVHFSASIV